MWSTTEVWVVGVVLRFEESHSYEPDRAPRTGGRAGVEHVWEGDWGEVSHAEGGAVVLPCLPFSIRAAVRSSKTICSRAPLGTQGGVPWAHVPIHVGTGQLRR